MFGDLSISQEIAILAIQLGVIIFAAKFCGILAKKAKMPSVLGELLAGILIGPCVLGAVQLPDFFLHLTKGLFFLPEGETFQNHFKSLYSLATLGSILLLFMSGIETDLRMFVRYSLVGTVVGLGGVIFSFAFGDAVGVWLLQGDEDFVTLSAKIMHPQSLFLGILCTATSVGITARILSEKKKVDTPEGVTILAAAVIDDVLGIICLAIVMGIVEAPQGAGVNWGSIGLTTLKCVSFWLIATVIGLILARYIAKFLRYFKSATIFGTLSFGLALLLSGLFEANGLSMIIGAYVMGLSLSKTDVAFAIQRALTPIYDFLVPVFFVVMGMLVDVKVFGDKNVLLLGLVYSLLAILAKIIGCALPSLFMNFNPLGALRIGTGMVPRGEVALIIAGIGMATMFNGKPILNDEIFGVALIMTLATTILAPPLLTLALGFKGKGVRKETTDASLVSTTFPVENDTIANFVYNHLTEKLTQEGYLLSHSHKTEGTLQIRNDDFAFALRFQKGKDGQTNFIFESQVDKVDFIKYLMVETIATINEDLKALEAILSRSGEKGMTHLQVVQDKILNGIEGGNAEKAAESLKTLLERAIKRDCIIMDLQQERKDLVICEMIDKLYEKRYLNEEQAAQCKNDVLAREQVLSTCLQDGVAIPHARTSGVDKIIATIGINKMGYQFDSMDGKPTKIFVLCLSPRDEGPHIEFIAVISAILGKEENVQAVLKADNSDELMNIFLQKEKTLGRR